MKFKEETSKGLHFERSFFWCWNLDTSGTRPDIPRKFWNVLWRRMEISWTVRVKNGEVLHRVKMERHIVHTVKWKNTNWIDHILRRNCLLKHIIKGQIEGSVEVTGRRGRRNKQILYVLKEREDTGNRMKKH